MNIVGKNLVLRAIEQEDLDSIHRWSNDPEVQSGLGGWHFPVSRLNLQRWVEGFRFDDTDQRFVIHENELGAVGLVTLTSINWKDRNAFHGVLIGERACRRKGVATAAVAAVMQYAFEELGLCRLDTTVAEFNGPSLDLHRKCGWETEGVKQMALFRGGRYWSNIVLGVTVDRYKQYKSEGRYDVLQVTGQ